ncbi:zinc finger BED domain-containing protein RICESLEEPER 3-like [Tripterygium wilfordii]|uniref:zinc finger BED domain-containing protein RICESLEEPER 3-like n=1 Tax=Tripterygium wilfordii TaxID=458696 RepID=UPI0018F84FA7|nr:zinc finger BED domain-containing protein RICESLEEPER 3-like [Tripterygium wilfordii]
MGKFEEEELPQQVAEGGGGGFGEGLGGEGSSMPTPITLESAGTNQKKRTRKVLNERSDVWTDFTKSPNRETCSCNHCGIMYKCHSSRNGTSTLKQHLMRCKRKPRASGQQTELAFNQTGKGDVSTWKYDSKVINDELTCMIVECELPFKFVEHPRFKSFWAALCPRYNPPTRPTVRKKTRGHHSKGRVIWSSLLTSLIVTGICKKRLSTLGQLLDTGEAMGRVIKNCLKDWEIKKLFTITVDNASSNDHFVNYLKRRFASIALGDYVHMRCVAHIINLVVSEGMKETIDSINRVRAAVQFIRASSVRIHKFKECVEMERIKSKSLLCLDVCTRWNSTFLMLEAAQKFESAFERFEELSHILRVSYH